MGPGRPFLCEQSKTLRYAPQAGTRRLPPTPAFHSGCQLWAPTSVISALRLCICLVLPAGRDERQPDVGVWGGLWGQGGQQQGLWGRSTRRGGLAVKAGGQLKRPTPAINSGELCSRSHLCVFPPDIRHEAGPMLPQSWLHELAAKSWTTTPIYSSYYHQLRPCDRHNAPDLHRLPRQHLQGAEHHGEVRASRHLAWEDAGVSPPAPLAMRLPRLRFGGRSKGRSTTGRGDYVSSPGTLHKQHVGGHIVGCGWRPVAGTDDPRNLRGRRSGTTTDQCCRIGTEGSENALSLRWKRRDLNMRTATATAPLGPPPSRRATAERHGPMSHESACAPPWPTH